ncbi:helix-turn-helix domain-containing protein [Rhodococcoides fascians]|uniref:helix-turn-helix domain-containing protein n=1 Tax=Rhodococcoides fascians TaxID=1828 RepID=UPI00050CDBD4|nr:helix-turn-helix domain-containing protein [Rhodococcus fascians]
MTNFNVVAELDVPMESITDELTDDIMAKIEVYHGTLGRSPLGRAQLTLTLPADTLRQASATAWAVLADAFPARTVLSMNLLLTDDFDRVHGLEPIPDLLSVSEAAGEMGVSRQRVLQLISTGSLPATKVGNAWLVPSIAVGRAG